MFFSRHWTLFDRVLHGACSNGFWDFSELKIVCPGAIAWASAEVPRGLPWVTKPMQISWELILIVLGSCSLDSGDKQSVLLYSTYSDKLQAEAAGLCMRVGTTSISEAIFGPPWIRVRTNQTGLCSVRAQLVCKPSESISFTEWASINMPSLYKRDEL